ncbi:hypothetical protein BCV72DRAFT_329510 [Rhizopus microsporus var. microsporus]|uniref:Uncharacterized protein n=1 Tax=Rhizopus microsporus var. microsporus TaxID=86635 RepID=A0A1X0R273_RHIZD|nr:hypothetical protein BCV72DRAFT_329510 [Rhizopus microsporus var. microsporus]
MLQLTKLPTMTGRTHILQAQFLLRSLSLPDDVFLTYFHIYVYPQVIQSGILYQKRHCGNVVHNILIS